MPIWGTLSGCGTPVGTQGRKLYGPATEQWTVALEGLAHHQQHARAPGCLRHMALTTSCAGKSPGRPIPVLEAYAPHDGLSLRAGPGMGPACRAASTAWQSAPGAPVPVPAVVHWKGGHYSAIVDRAGAGGEFNTWSRIRCRRNRSGSARGAGQETSGYFLAPEDDLARAGGWRASRRPRVFGAVAGRGMWTGGNPIL